jgi:phosphoglycerate dehydrogenase-like enzyme
LDRERLNHLQQDAVFVLISRSHVVDFEALTELVTAGRFKAAIDVFPQEPLPFDHPIRQAPNVILSAHLAGSVPKDLRTIGRMVVNDIRSNAGRSAATRNASSTAGNCLSTRIKDGKAVTSTGFKWADLDMLSYRGDFDKPSYR